MKHFTLGNARYYLPNKAPGIFTVVLFFSIAMASCKKDQMPDETRSPMPLRSLETDMGLDSIMLNKTVLKMKLQYKDNFLSQAFHYDNYGIPKKQASYAILFGNQESEGTTHDLSGKILRVKVKDEGTYDYEYDPMGRIVRSKFYAEGSLFLRPDRIIEFEYDTDVDGNDFLVWQRNYGGAGLDVLIGSTGYDRNPDGTINSISLYEGPEMKLKGKVILQNSATPAQVAAWKQISSHFPEPEKPWEMLTMLSQRIEMKGSGTVGNESIINGKIIIVKETLFVSERVGGLIYSGESGGMNEAMSFHYSPIMSYK